MIMEARREILHAVSWQVRSNVWSPPTDEYETEEAYVVRVEIAGMREDDFEVLLENDTLLISGSRSDFPDRRAYQQMEIRFGKFATSVSIPNPVNVDQARAEYKDGFLTVVLPKVTPNQIKVE
jgi:HSP20 family protein